MTTSVLRVCLERVEFLPATRATDDSSILTLRNLVSEPLLRWKKGVVVPALFARWTHSPDGHQWRFFLREGATFHDGTPCVAGDVVSFITDVLEAVDGFGMQWPYARYLSDTCIWATDDKTVCIEGTRPIAHVLDVFAELYLSRMGDEGASTLGTGPYRVVSYEAKHRAVLERVRPIGRQTLILEAERIPEERLRLLRQGRVDAAMNLERVNRGIEFDAELKWFRAASTLSVMAYLNCREGIFRSRNARLAANYAVDTVALASDVFHGLAIPSRTVASPFHLGSSNTRLTPIRYDPDTARSLLDGVDVRQVVRLRTPTTMPERAPEIAAFVSDALEAVGLEVETETVADRAEYAHQVSRKEIGDIALFDSSPHSTYRILNDKISSTIRGTWWQGFEDAEAERLIESASRAVVYSERRVAYARCLQYLHENPPWLYLVHPIEVLGCCRSATGLAIDHEGKLDVA